MSEHAIHEIIGTAIVDQEFCRTLLEGDRAALLTTFDLLPAERRKLLAIQAHDLHTFAQQVYDWRIQARLETVTVRSAGGSDPAPHACATHTTFRSPA